MSDRNRRRQERLAEEVIQRTRGCLPAGELAAYHDGTIRPQNRSTLEAHLPGCTACRAALDYLASEASNREEKGSALPDGIEKRLGKQIESMIAEEAHRSGPYAAGPGWMKLAAGLILVISIGAAGYMWWTPEGFDQNLGELRSNGELQALEPIGRIASIPARFAWSPHSLATFYEVHLFDAEMNEIWNGRPKGDATDLVIDEMVGRIVAAGGDFSWQVWALDRKEFPVDRSPIIHFEIAPGSPTR